jgi:hypothetical protein
MAVKVSSGDEHVKTTGTGLYSISLRRVCLAILLAGAMLDLVRSHDVDRVLFWYVALLIYGGLIAAAVQHVYRSVRVGRAETATMIATTVTFTAALLLAPRVVATTSHVVSTQVTHPGDIFPSTFTSVSQSDLFNAPLLELLGHRSSASADPWLAIALVLAGLSMVGICLQWVLVYRLGKGRRGVFNPATG